MNKLKHFPKFTLLVLVLCLLPITAFAADLPQSINVCGIMLKSTEIAQGCTKDISTVQIGGPQSGSFTWDPQTNTLTITNIQSDSGCVKIAYPQPNASSKITIRYEGTNVLNAKTNDYPICVTNVSAKLEATENAALTLNCKSGTYAAVAVYSGDLLFSGGSITSNSSIIADSITMDNCAYTINPMPEKIGAIIWPTIGDFNVIDSALTVLCTSDQCYPLYATANLVVNRSSLHVDAVQDTPVLYVCGNTSIENSSLTSEGLDTLLYCSGNATISDTVFDLESIGDSALYSSGNMNLTNVVGTINVGAQGYHPISTKGNLTIDGAKTDLTTLSPSPLSARGLLTIEDGKLNVHAKKVAITGNAGVTLNGGQITAVSDTDAAIFSVNGTITLNTDNIDATSGNNVPTFIARNKNALQDPSQPISDRIIIGPEYEVPGAKVATTVWLQDSAGNLYADTILIPSNASVNQEGLLDNKDAALTGQLIVRQKSASIPSTGDSSQPVAMALLCTAALAGIALTLKKRAHSSSR